LDSISEILTSLGYRLFSAQNSWRTNALYRGGGNPNSLIIDKRTGVFTDFGTGKSGSFRELVSLTTKDESIVSKIVDLDKYAYTTEVARPKIVMEKIWDKNELNNIIPHYSFYENKGISKDTLRFFQSGMQHSGTLNQRYVFPIFNSLGQIHGWSGRDMTNKKSVKWYKIGSSNSWVYPYYVNHGNNYPSKERIEETKEVFLVESIGDMLALWERDVKNVLVIFGASISTKLCSHLMSLKLNRVIISSNNDFDKTENTGKNIAINTFIKLLPYVDYKKLSIALPYKCNDFGDIDDEKFNVWKSRVENPNYPEIYKAVLGKMREMNLQKKISKTTLGIAKAIKDDCENFTN